MAEAQKVARDIHWITERRLVPELVSHDEIETDEEDPEYKGLYWMERPHVNFWLDFTNQELISFRQHSNKYQSARNMLADSRMAYGVKKSADDRSMVRSERYHQYQNTEVERFTRPTRSHLLRRTASIENMIQYKTETKYKKPFGAYFDYGCHCFTGNFIDPKRSNHAEPVDNIDRACQRHKWAYDCAKDDYGNDCRGKYQLYKWEGTVDDDGISTSIKCIDAEDTCERSICEIDRHLAEELSALAIGYNPFYKHSERKQVGAEMFDRMDVCEHQQMEVVDRDDHNNNVHVVPDVPSPVQTYSNTDPADTYADHATDDWDLGSLGTILPVGDAASPSGSASMGRGSASSEDEYPYDVNASGDAWETPEVYGADSGNDAPFWQFIEMSERGNWGASGWNVPDVEFIPPPKKDQEDNFNFGGFPNFAPVDRFDGPIIADSPAPIYTHNDDPVDTEDALDEAIAQVQSATPAPPSNMPSNDLLADHATDFSDPADSPASGSNADPNSKSYTPEQAALSNSQEEVAAPQPVLKAAATFNHQKCCGEYPRRYKYSSNKQGCCIENTGPYANKWGYLYSPQRGSCCIKTVTSTRGSITYTRYAGQGEVCDDLLEQYNR